MSTSNKRTIPCHDFETWKLRIGVLLCGATHIIEQDYFELITSALLILESGHIKHEGELIPHAILCIRNADNQIINPIDASRLHRHILMAEFDDAVVLFLYTDKDTRTSELMTLIRDISTPNIDTHMKLFMHSITGINRALYTGQ